MYRSSKVWSWGTLIAAGGIAFSLSCVLATVPERDDDGTHHRSGVELLLGRSRLAFSRYFYEMADVYFHKGVEHLSKRAFQGGFFQDLSQELSPERVVHMAGTGIKEMMPWIWLAIRMDPHNLEPYLVGAFLLSREVGRPDLAHEVLREAQYNNPYNYEAPLEEARLYLKEKKTRDAQHALDVAMAFWPGGRDANAPDVKDDKATILTYRGLLHEVDGENANAIGDYRAILELFPDRAMFQHRIDKLEQGSQPSVLATRVWRDMLREQDKQTDARHDAEHGREHGSDAP